MPQCPFSPPSVPVAVTAHRHAFFAKTVAARCEAQAGAERGWRRGGQTDDCVVLLSAVSALTVNQRQQFDLHADTDTDTDRGGD